MDSTPRQKKASAFPYATQPTIDLCSVVLPDSGHLQEEDAAFYNKRKVSKHDTTLPLYTLEEAQDCLQYFKPVVVGRTMQFSRELSFRVRAGRILGSVHGGSWLTRPRRTIPQVASSRVTLAGCAT